MMSCTGRSGLVNRRSSRVGIVQQQVRSLVGREAARKAQRQARRDRTDASPHRPPRAARRTRPVAGTSVRGRIRRATCWRQCEIARARRRRRGECPAPERLRRAQPAVLSAGFCPELIGRRRVPASACERRWSRVRPALRPPASAETAAAKRCRLTSPCKRLTPFTAPLPRIARYAMLKSSAESSGFWRPSASKSCSVMPELLLARSRRDSAR